MNSIVFKPALVFCIIAAAEKQSPRTAEGYVEWHAVQQECRGRLRHIGPQPYGTSRYVEWDGEMG